MKKDFQNWHYKKIRINEIIKPPFFHERGIWFCSLGANIGFEQDGRGEAFLRPVVIVRKFNNEIFWAVPLTKTEKSNAYYFPFLCNGARSVAILSQVRLIDARRLSYKIGDIAQSDFSQMKEKLKALLP